MGLGMLLFSVKCISSFLLRLSTSALLPLKNMRFVLSGKMNKEKYQGKIEALGGKVKNTVDKDTLALISDKGKDYFV